VHPSFPGISVQVPEGCAAGDSALMAALPVLQALVKDIKKAKKFTDTQKAAWAGALKVVELIVIDDD
jgi:hypothetical protein